MFYDRPDCIKLAEKIFLFKNALPKELIDHLNKAYMEMDQSTLEYEDTLIEWYSNKVATEMPTPRIHEAWELISDILYPEYILHPSVNVLAVKPGDGGMFVHADSPGRGCEDMLTQLDEFSTCCIIDYGLVMYLGEWTGGAIFYPQLNPDGTPKMHENVQEGCFEYTPEIGDIIIHSAHSPYEHGVREVESGTRFAYSNFVLRMEDNPGSFYTYKTPEYYEQLGEKEDGFLKRWIIPLYQSDVSYKLRKEFGKEIPDLPTKDQLLNNK
jgi:hypothetical protein